MMRQENRPLVSQFIICIINCLEVKIMRKKCAVFLTLLLVFLIGCNDDLKNNTQKVNKTSNDSQLYLTTQSDKDFISIQISGEKFTESQIEYIKKEVSIKLLQFTENNFELYLSDNKPTDKEVKNTDYYINISSKIMCYSKDIVSVIFEGTYNKIDAAHPTHLFFSINFNPDTLEEICFGDKYIIDEELYNNFSNSAIENIKEECDGAWPEQLGDFHKDFISKEVFINSLNSENTSQSVIQCYYNANSVGFSYETSFALGCHKEVELPIEILKSKR